MFVILVGLCDLCLTPGVTTLLFSSSTMVSGAFLSVWLSVDADPLRRIIRGAHEMLSLVRTAWLCVQPEVSDGTTLRVFVLQPGVRGALQAKY